MQKWCYLVNRSCWCTVCVSWDVIQREGIAECMIPDPMEYWCAGGEIKGNKRKVMTEQGWRITAVCLCGATDSNESLHRDAEGSRLKIGLNPSIKASLITLDNYHHYEEAVSLNRTSNTLFLYLST